MTSRFPDHLVLTRPGAPTQDATTKVITNAAGTTLYDGPCDAQDVPEVLARDVTGIPTMTAEVPVYLPWKRWVPGVQLQDVAALILLDGTHVTGLVVKVRHLDRTILLGHA